MKKLFFALLYFGAYFNCNSQSIQWQRVFGGSLDDEGRSIISFRDSSFAICGSAESNDGDIYIHYSNNSQDVLLILLDSVGNSLWNYCYGGIATDLGREVVSTNDNKLLIQAISTSTNGDITGMHDHGPDIWLAKLYDQDSISWGNCFGSFDYETAYDVIQTADSGFVAIAETDGDDGDVSGNHAAGNTDIWVFKIDKNGVLQWQVCLGSWTFDGAGALAVTPDNGILIIGSAVTGQGGTVQCSSSIMGENLWLVKLDSAGNVLWDKCYGSSANDEGVDIIASPNGGYYVLGVAGFNDGDVTSIFGQVDFWLLRIDDSGNLLWQKCYGGSYLDIPYSIALASNGDVLMCGLTNSNNGQTSSNHGSNDVFIVRTDSSGNLLWSQCYGGTGSDIGYSIAVSSDGFPVFTGMTESNDGDVSGNHGGKDLWVVKLNESPVGVSETTNSLRNFSCSYSKNNLIIDYYSEKNENDELSVYNTLGKIEFQINLNTQIGSNHFQIPIQIINGFKIVSLVNENNNGVSTKMVVSVE